MREVKISGDTVNCERGKILRAGDFVQRVLSESGKPAEQSSGTAFRDSGAIDKGVRMSLAGRAVIGCLHVSHFQDLLAQARSE